MPRKRVDLRKLPVWQQYVIAITTVVAVVAAAWMIGRDQPVPLWITNWLVPVLGVLYLVLVIIAVAYWLKNRK